MWILVALAELVVAVVVEALYVFVTIVGGIFVAVIFFAASLVIADDESGEDIY